MTPPIYHNHDATCSACGERDKAFEAMREALDGFLEDHDMCDHCGKRGRAALALADEVSK